MAKKAINLKLAQQYYPKNDKGLSAVVSTNDTSENLYKRQQILRNAFNAWSALDGWRFDCTRNERFVFGDQWGDPVYNHDSKKWISEKNLILLQGNQPLQNNIIRNIVRSILGVFSSNKTEPICFAKSKDGDEAGEMMSATIQGVYQNNNLWDLDRRSLEFLIISGLAVSRGTYAYRNGQADVWNDIVNYNNFFFDNTMQDPRGWDCKILGQLHDLPVKDVISMFASGSKEKANRIKDIYSHSDEFVVQNINTFTEDTKFGMNFFSTNSASQSLCRVIEVWQQESRECFFIHDYLSAEYYPDYTITQEEINTINSQRVLEQGNMGILPENMKLIDSSWGSNNIWCYYILAPTGEVLDEGESPYLHGGHPFSFKLHTSYNGRIYPFVSDLIDIQKHINRILVSTDIMRRHAAKGALLYDDKAKPEDASWPEIQQAWASYDKLIPYTSERNGQVPTQIYTQGAAFSQLNVIGELTNMMRDVSGVYGALQGASASAGTPASMYSQQSQNSATSLVDLFEAFNTYREDRDKKNLQLIIQYYEDNKYVKIDKSERIMFDKKKIKGIEFDLSIVENTATPAHRMAINEMLLKLIPYDKQGLIGIKELIQSGQFQGMEKLLQIITTKEEEMNQMQQQGAIPPPQVQ